MENRPASLLIVFLLLISLPAASAASSPAGMDPVEPASDPSPLGHGPPYWTAGTVEIQWAYHDSFPPFPPGTLAKMKLQYRFRDGSNVSSDPWSDFQTKAAFCPFGPALADCVGSFDFTFGQQGRAEFQFVPLDSSDFVLSPQPDIHPAVAGWDTLTPLVGLSGTGPWWKTSRTVSITYSGVDPTAIDSLVLRRYFRASNASAWSPPTTVVTAPPDSFGTTINDVVSADGFYRYEVQAWDEAGNTETRALDLGVDSTAPTPSLSLPGAYWRDATAVSLPFSATDPGSGDLNHGISQIRLYSATRPDNATSWSGWSLVTSTSAASGTFVRTVSPNIHTKFGLISRDGLGIENSAVVDFPATATSYDTGLPGGTINAAGFWKSNRTFTLSYSATDNMASDGSLRNLTLHEFYSPNNSTFSITSYSLWTSSVFSGPVTRNVGLDGWYRHSMYVYDKAANAGITGALLAVDTGAPIANASTTSPYWTAGSATVHFDGRDVFQGRDDVSLSHVALEQRYSADNITFGSWGQVDLSNFPPASKDFNWVTATEGFYSFRSKSVDRAGNLAYSATIPRGFDTSPPTASLSATRFWQTANVNLSLDATDQLLLRNYTLYYETSADNSSWGPSVRAADALLSGASANLSIGATVPSDGYYRFRVVVFDVSGKQAADITVVAVDVAKPLGTVAQTGPYWIDSTDVDLSYGGFDAVNLTLLVVQQRTSPDNVSWSAWSAILTISAGPFNGSFKQALASEGHFQFGAVAFDAAGNSNTLATQARAGRDDSAPRTTGSAGAYWHRTPFVLSLRADDTLGLMRVLVQMRSSPDNSTWSPWSTHLDVDPGGMNWAANSTFAPASEGYYEFEVTATDRSGKQHTSTIEVGSDRTPPRSGLGGLGNHTAASAFGIAVTVDDKLSGLASLELWSRKDGASWIRYATFPNTQVYFDSGTTGGDGRYEFRAVGIDSAGNLEAKTTADLTTIVDTRPPAISSSSPAQNETNVPVNSAVTIKFDESVDPAGRIEMYAGLVEVPAMLDWSSAGDEVTLRPKALLAPVAEYEVLVADVKDIAGNPMVAVKWKFTSGSVPPTVITTSPLNGSTVWLGSVELRFTFSSPMTAASAQAVQTNWGTVATSDLAGSSLRVVMDFTAGGPVEIRILASKAFSTAGTALDGDGDGAPGGDFVLHLEVVPGTGSLRGVVKGAGGAAIADATVTLAHGGTLVAANRSAADGVVVIEGLDAGKYRLTASHPGYATSFSEITIESGKVTPVDITLVPESDLAAWFPGGVIGLGLLLLMLAVIAAVGLLMMIRRRRRRKSGDEEGVGPGTMEANEPTHRGSDDGSPVERGPAADADDHDDDKTGRDSHGPPIAVVRVRTDSKSVERDATGEPAPEDVEKPARVVDAGTARLGAKKTDFGCPVCGHLVSAKADACPGCGAEVNW